jgi:CubicO group peptidase (beta-lactamase class C family)
MVASITKTFTGTLLAHALVDGKIKLMMISESI